MSLIDDIKKDREAGTPGPWAHLHDKYEGDAIMAKGPRWVVRRMRDPDTDYDVVDIPLDPDARRIARVPDVEAALLEADEAVTDLSIAADNIQDAAKSDPRWDGVAEKLRARVAAYRKATGEVND